MCFYRLSGPGANPNSCWEAVDKFGIWDSMIPMPVLAVFFLYAALMQPLMILDKLASLLIDRNLPCTEVLPRFYKLRFGGHFFQLAGNKMRLKDLVAPVNGFLLIDIVLIGFVELMSVNLAIAAILLLVVSLVFLLRSMVMEVPMEGKDKQTQELGDKLLQNGAVQSEYGSLA